MIIFRYWKANIYGDRGHLTVLFKASDFDDNHAMDMEEYEILVKNIECIDDEYQMSNYRKMFEKYADGNKHLNLTDFCIMCASNGYFSRKKIFNFCIIETESDASIINGYMIIKRKFNDFQKKMGRKIFGSMLATEEKKEFWLNALLQIKDLFNLPIGSTDDALFCILRIKIIENDIVHTNIEQKILSPYAGEYGMEEKWNDISCQVSFHGIDAGTAISPRSAIRRFKINSYNYNPESP